TSTEREVPGMQEDYEARLTLRLPTSLKELVEEAAGRGGDSINSWVVKTLMSKARTGRPPGRRVSGTFDI
ncbi:MAG: toxin-antitoxin system HicB family antitoxin, partial [Acidimicrobiia bacterium]